MLLPPRRIAGALGFAASIAASANVPGYLLPSAEHRSPAFVREFSIDSAQLKAHPIALVRDFALDDLKADWQPEQDLAEDILFENEFNASGPDGSPLVTRITEVEEEAAPPLRAAEPEGHFFLDRYIPLEGDTLRHAANRLGCIPELLSLLNSRAPVDKVLNATRPIHIYRGPVTAHTIQKGETLWSIARSFRIPLRELIWLNRLRSLDIQAGRTVYVARGIVSKNVERRAATDLPTSELLAQAKQRMQGGKEASAAASLGIRVTRPVAGRISSGFGWRRHPFKKRTILHKGVDISARKGTRIRALYEGKVGFAGWDSRGGGNTVIIYHAGSLRTSYAHLDVLHVSTGDHVPQGTVIGRVGMTGQATAPHLHFGMARGRSILDPLPFLR